jgi:hypothetical protein
VRAADERHRKSETAPVASGFATDLGREECWTNPSVALWAFGHTHFSCDFSDGGRGKRVVANQRGYDMALESTFVSAKTSVAGPAPEAASSTSSMLLV